MAADGRDEYKLLSPELMRNALLTLAC
jgi:hypothetical protein